MEHHSSKLTKCRKKTTGISNNLVPEISKQLAEVYLKLKRDMQGYKIVVNKENIQVKPPKLIELDLRNIEKNESNDKKVKSNNTPLSEQSVIKKVKCCNNTNI